MAQGPIEMPREYAEMLSEACDIITRGVIEQVEDFTDIAVIRREMYRVIGVQLIEGKLEVGKNHDRLKETENGQ